MKARGILQYRSQVPQTPQDSSSALLGSLQLFQDLQRVKDSVEKTLDSKVEEVEGIIDEAQTTVREGADKIDAKVAEFEDTAITLIKEIQSLPHIQGNAGKDGVDADEERMVETVLSRIPAPKELDEEKLLKRFISKIPEHKASLKIIQEKFETDPMSVIDKILALPEGKFKLKTSHVDGLDQTISAFRNQLATGKGYLHGGGDTVVAGTNITLVRLANGKTQINATASPTTFVDNEVVAGSNTSWTLAGTPTLGSEHLYGNGQRLTPIVDYTISGAVVTTVKPFSAGTLLADYRT